MAMSDGSGSFQFHYGAILTHCRRHEAHQEPQLSIPLWCDSNLLGLVLLELVCYTFQFHYGAILTWLSISVETDGTNFQFHYGAILTWTIVVVAAAAVSTFNSTMVRF